MDIFHILYLRYFGDARRDSQPIIVSIRVHWCFASKSTVFRYSFGLKVFDLLSEALTMGRLGYTGTTFLRSCTSRDQTLLLCSGIRTCEPRTIP